MILQNGEGKKKAAHTTISFCKPHYKEKVNHGGNLAVRKK